MFAKVTLPALLAASGAFACAASTKCIPDVYARQFTLVKGDVDAMMVQEYSLANGCAEVTIDSIVRRGVDPDSLRIAKNTWVDGISTPSSAVTVYGSWTSPKLDSAAAVACSKVRVERHVDSIPRSHLYFPGPADEPVEKVAPVDSDSVYVCLNGSCSKIIPRVVNNVSPFVDCMIGVTQPFGSQEEAIAFLRNKIASNPLRPRILDRLRIAYNTFPLVDCMPGIVLDTFTIVEDVAARKTSTSDVVILPPAIIPTAATTETRFTIDNGYYSSLPMLRSWNDPSISPRLALPSNANAGDLFQPETLQFQSNDLQGDHDYQFLSYATGVQQYEYRGDTRYFMPCGDPSSLSLSTKVGDSLRLKGINLLLSSQASCPVDGQDIYASKYNRWLYLPTDDGPFQADFAHTFQAENALSWPIVNDSVQIRGQKVALATLQAFVSTLPRQGRLAPLAARMVDGFLSVTLENSSNVRVSTPDGRVLSSSQQPAGTSRIALPRHHHGLLLVDAGSSSARVMAP